MRSLFALQNEQIREKIRQFNVNFNFDGTPYRFEKFMGFGAYGLVCSATVSDSGDRVAIKRLSDAFANDLVAKRAFREIKILRHLSHPNVISLRGIFVQQARLACDVYLVLDFMPMDLHGFLKQRLAVAMSDIRYIFYQLMCGLSCIHSIGVAHRDLKPSNLLIDADMQLKICDFGMSRHLSQDQCSDRQQLTAYVATRRYRAPELLLKAAMYTTAVDIWSAGCILGELLTGRPLFPGERVPDIVGDMAQLLGPLPDCLALLLDEKATASRVSHGMSLTEFLASVSPEAAAVAPLMLRLLSYDARHRPSASDVLHGDAFLACLRGARPEAETLPHRLELLDFSRLEASLQTAADIRAAIELEAQQLSAVPLAAASSISTVSPAASETADADDAAAASFLQSLLQASPMSSVLSSSPQISPMSAAAASCQMTSDLQLPTAQLGMSRVEILQRLQQHCAKHPGTRQQPASPAPNPPGGPGSFASSASPSYTHSSPSNSTNFAEAATIGGGLRHSDGGDPMLAAQFDQPPSAVQLGAAEAGGHAVAAGLSFVGLLSPSVLELLSGFSPMNCDQAMQEFRQAWPIHQVDLDELMRGEAADM